MQLEAAYQQICGAIAVLEELVPSDEITEIEPSPNGQVEEEEMVNLKIETLFQKETIRYGTRELAVPEMSVW